MGRVPPSELRALRAAVWRHWKAHGRHDLPWRKTADPYRILVSEVMLQQTQVDRVIPYYHAWLRKFPSVRVLARASLAEVLIAWQGLGYNRRAKMLHQAAQAIASDCRGRFPESVQDLERLPGIGPYTARAVAAFAYNQDVVLVETNVRTVILHHCFPKRTGVSDADIAEVLATLMPKRRAREWYAALMDYGAHLKRSGVHTNAQVKGYTKQKAFTGSAREARGALLKTLVSGPAKKNKLLGLLGETRRDQLSLQLASLLKEGLVERFKGGYRLPT